jgi:hypothetical protein
MRGVAFRGGKERAGITIRHIYFLLTYTSAVSSHPHNGETGDNLILAVGAKVSRAVTK